MNILDFDELSIKNIDISLELSDIFYDNCLKRFKNNSNIVLYKANSKYDLYNIIKDIEDLLITVCSNENIEITFEIIQQKILNFYLKEADEVCIYRHLTALETCIKYDVMTKIYDNAIYSSETECLLLNVIIEFVKSTEGINYLQKIYDNIFLLF